jgi:hypothetical protein
LKYLFVERLTLIFSGLKGSILNPLKEKIVYAVQKAKKYNAKIKEAPIFYGSFSW